jgi:uncharacterized protein (TIRG00374 family)
MDDRDSALRLPEPPAPKPSRRFIRPLAGFLVAAACLAWLLHDVPPREALKVTDNIRWTWVAAAVAFDILSYICQGWRWRLLLKPIGEISLWRATQAVYVGLFTNEMLPMRLGEVSRVYLVSRWMPSTFTSVLPSVVVERFFDAVWLALSIGLMAVFVPLPPDLVGAGDTLGVAVLLATVVFLGVVYLKRKEKPRHDVAEPQGSSLIRRIKRLLNNLESGIRRIGPSKSFFLSFAVSALILLGQILAFWLTMRACRLELPLMAGAVVLLVVRLGTAIPNAPANLGTYQFFVVVGLAIFGVDKALATGFSFVVFLILTVPLWLIGSLALSHSGMTLSSIRTGAGKLAE